MANRKYDCDIGIRFVTECIRIFGTQAEALRRLNAEKTTFYSWRSGSTPSSFWLAKLHYLGGEVMYVLNGKRSEGYGK